MTTTPDDIDTDVARYQAHQREQAIAGLIDLATFLNSHPEVPVPDLDRIGVIVAHDPAAALAWMDGMDDLVLADPLTPSADYAYIVREFGPFRMTGMVRRATVCPDGVADLDAIRARLTTPALDLDAAPDA